MTGIGLGLRVVVTATVVALFVTAGLPRSEAWPATWTVGLQASSSGETLSLGLPSAPGGVSASCTGLLLSPTAKVTWSAVARATSYAVYQSSTSSTSGFSQAASGITVLTWTSATLGTGSFWFRVVAYDGTNWASAQSSSTAAIVVLLGVSCT